MPRENATTTFSSPFVSARTFLLLIALPPAISVTMTMRLRTLPGMILAVLCLAQSMLVQLSRAHMIELKPSSKECFFEDLSPGDQVRWLSTLRETV